ncbi:MAG: hypothetical protein ACTHOE_05775 [Conexibacter sp.]
MRRSRVLIVAAVAVLALAGYVAFRLATHESSEPASVAAALARFRALSPAARTLPPRLRGRALQPGVYVYATRGFEVSHVLGARRHPYPSRTTITVSVTPRGCLRTRWDVLATRHDAALICPPRGAGWRLVDQSEEHEFAGHVDRRTYACTPSSADGPPRMLAGARWRSRCAIAGTTTTDDSVVIGPRTLMLDGRRTLTLLVRTTTHVSGNTIGAGTAFTWLLPRSGVIVRRTLANASTTSTIVGPVRYEERATLMLTSARPHR